jgi:predicted DCC family thiol-disulfide oxidoreductase YuxK
MQALTVLYDARCKLCRGVRAWLEAQPAYVELVFVPAGSTEARRRFPQLDHTATTSDLTVISDEGAVYFGANGWLMCLWALREYRGWSLKLSAPELLPLARRVVVWVSQNRFRLGQLEDVPDDALHAAIDMAMDDSAQIDCADGCSVG